MGLGLELGLEDAQRTKRVEEELPLTLTLTITLTLTQRTERVEEEGRLEPGERGDQLEDRAEDDDRVEDVEAWLG